MVAALVVALALVALIAVTRGGDGGPASPTTTTTRASTTTTTAPTTTVVTCEQLQSQYDALDNQERQIEGQLKGKALQDAKRQLDAQKQALDKALKSCD